MSASAWRALVDHGHLPDLLRIFGPHIVFLIRQERRRP